MSTAIATAGAPRRVLVRPGVRVRGPLAVAAVVALAGVLRFVSLGATATDPFYDASVRSMSTSWHAFLVGAFDPSAGVSIDKPPLDLWLQVASTRALGFTPFALLLPVALSGTLAVLLLWDLLRTLAGPRSALLGALALAVLPLAVISSRSDTMDSVMAALLIAAFAVAARGLRRADIRYAVAAGALVGLAFEVKLFEALLPAPALALLWWTGARGSRRRRLAGLGAGAAAAVLVGLAWLALLTVAVGAAHRPWAFGSSHGSAWSAALIYDGWDRLRGGHVPGVAPATALAAARVPAPPGPLRLLSTQDQLAARIGVELVAAWAAVALLGVTRAWRPLGREGRAGLLALIAWLALGTLAFSAQAGLRPRYLEALDPAIAACLGLGVVLSATALGGRRGALAVAGAVAVLLASTGAAAAAVSRHAQDSGTVGAAPPGRVERLSAYLLAHQGGARYEVATLATSPAAPLIVRDGRPVLVLTAAGRAVVGAPRLALLARHGAVHDALVGNGCRSAACSRLRTWIQAHGVNVSRAAGLSARAGLYALPGAAR